MKRKLLPRLIFAPKARSRLGRSVIDDASVFRGHFGLARTFPEFRGLPPRKHPSSGIFLGKTILVGEGRAARSSDWRTENEISVRNFRISMLIGVWILKIFPAREIVPIWGKIDTQKIFRSDRRHWLKLRRILFGNGMLLYLWLLECFTLAFLPWFRALSVSARDPCRIPGWWLLSGPSPDSPPVVTSCDCWRFLIRFARAMVWRGGLDSTPEMKSGSVFTFSEIFFYVAAWLKAVNYDVVPQFTTIEKMRSHFGQDMGERGIEFRETFITFTRRISRPSKHGGEKLISRKCFGALRLTPSLSLIQLSGLLSLLWDQLRPRSA